MNYDLIRALRAMGFPEAKLKTAAVNVQAYKFTSVAGSTQQNLQVPGNSKAVLGILVNTGNPRTDSFSLTVNNEKIIQDMASALADAGSYTTAPNGFFPIMRVLTGKDIITSDYSSVAGGDAINFAVIYLTV